MPPCDTFSEFLDDDFRPKSVAERSDPLWQGAEKHEGKDQNKKDGEPHRRDCAVLSVQNVG